MYRNLFALIALLLIPTIVLAQVIFPNRGGTGNSTLPSQDQMLVGNGVSFDLLTLTPGNNVTIATSSGKLTINASLTGGGLTTDDIDTAAEFDAIVTDGALSDDDFSDNDTDDLAEGSNLYYTDARARAALSETVPGLTYTSGTGVLSLTAGYTIPLLTSVSEWDAAYGWGNHADEGYLTSSPFGADIGVSELASADFGDFTCNGSTCSLDATYLTGNETITLSGDITGSGATAITTALSTNAVADNEIDYTAVTLADFTNDAGYFDSLADFTGTLTDTKICVYDQAGGEIDCNYTDQTGAGGGDEVLIDGSAVTNPNFVSTGDIDFVDTSNTITANINAGAVGIAELASVDFGDFTCNGSTCLLDASYLTGNQTITLSGDITGSGATAITTALSTNSVADNEIDYTAVTLADFSNDAGFITSANDTVSGSELDGVFSSTGLLKRTGANTYTTITDSSSNWNTAYGWGDHSSEGYLTASPFGASVGPTELESTDFGDFTCNGTTCLLDATYLTTVDISADTNLAAGTGLTLSGDTINLDNDFGSSIDTGEITDDTITHADIADADQTVTMCIYIEDPTADDDLQSIWANKTANDFTLTELWAESDQTVNLDLQVDDGTPADVNGTDIAPAAGEAEDTSLSGDTTVAAGEELDLAITSVSGTPTWVSICWTGNWAD